MIPSFEIQNYRLFKHLTIEKLGRVNLITGKNNVGKTALLEALRLYTSGGNPRKIREILKTRYNLAEFNSLAIRDLFRYQSSDEKIMPILLNESQNELSSLMSIHFVRYVKEWDENNESHKIRILDINENEFSGSNHGLKISINSIDKSMIISLSDTETGWEGMGWKADRKYPVCSYLPPHMIYMNSIMDLWNKIILTPAEEEIISCLKLMDNTIEKVALVGNSETSKSPVFVAKITNTKFPIPLNNLGEGMNRLLGISVLMVNSKNGTVLIDEIENGIHYSIQPKLWKLIFELAERLNVQVFATTHSWDAVVGFQEALKDFHDPDQGQLIRLENIEGDNHATIFSADKLSTATRRSIEVR